MLIFVNLMKLVVEWLLDLFLWKECLLAVNFHICKINTHSIFFFGCILNVLMLYILSNDCKIKCEFSIP